MFHQEIYAGISDLLGQRSGSWPIPLAGSGLWQCPLSGACSVAMLRQGVTRGWISPRLHLDEAQGYLAGLA